MEFPTIPQREGYHQRWFLFTVSPGWAPRLDENNEPIRHGDAVLHEKPKEEDL